MIKKYLEKLCRSLQARLHSSEVLLVWCSYTSAPRVYYKNKKFAVQYNKLSREQRTVLSWEGVSEAALGLLDEEVDLLRYRPNSCGYAVYVPSDYES